MSKSRGPSFDSPRIKPGPAVNQAEWLAEWWAYNGDGLIELALKQRS